MKLPDLLLDKLADSEFEVICWDGEQARLSARLTKDAKKETGVITFSGVVHICLEPRLTLSCLRLASPGEMPVEVASDEQAVVMEGSWGEKCWIIAEQLTYEIISDPEKEERVSK
jgi:hypothetical protein